MEDEAELLEEIEPLEDAGIFETEFQAVLHGQDHDCMSEGFLPCQSHFDNAYDLSLDAIDRDRDEDAPLEIESESHYQSIEEDAVQDFVEDAPPSEVKEEEEDQDPNLDELAKSEPPYEDAPEPAISSPTAPQSQRLEVVFPESTLSIPRSCYEPFEPGVPVLSEREAVYKLRWAAKEAGQIVKAFVEFQLDNFAVYTSQKLYPEEMRSLHHLDTRTGTSNGNLFFDGILSVGDIRYFVKRVPIAALPIDNYGTFTKHTTRGKIWLQSDINVNREIYYRLGTPAKEYRRFFEPFLWVADLAKHFVDFLKVMSENKRKVTIFHFRTTFNTWLKKVHKTAPAFVAWRKQHPSEDFRSSVVANLGFLYKEAIGVLGHKKTYFHPLWAETWNHSHYKPYKSKDETENPPTVVTQYIYDCFEHLPFGDRLEVVPLSKETETLRNELIHKERLELPRPVHEQDKNISTASSSQKREIKPGDTISTHRDGEGSGTEWRRDISHGFNDVDRWFALVQSVKTDRRGRRIFDVIWYYRAVDTLCGLMKYPWNNELFLSDHCSCAENIKIREDEVLGVHDVEFFGTSQTQSEFFCRQTYVHTERKWVTLQNEHLRCEHTQEVAPAPKYSPGDTLLVVIDLKSKRSEPCEFVSSYQEEGRTTYRFRRLLRLQDIHPKSTTARPNELVYSNRDERLVDVSKSRIQEPCYVRCFTPGQSIPTPYDRDGVGGFFFISHEEVKNEDGTFSYVPLATIPPSLKQSYDPEVETPKLRGLDLFCGGGNFGRGLEDGGGVEMKWANDYEAKAIHTYMANTPSPEAVAPFHGSIDDLQRLAIKGRFSASVPQIGAVDFISGGSPCPGFSHLTNDKTTIKQRKNQSLVAAFASFIDLYRPKYGLLENVTGIVQKKKDRDQDVFSQLICAVVGLGYQVQFFFLDASSCGSPQRRARVFLAFAAPGYKLPRRPLQTHSHPEFTKPLTLGNLPNGQGMAVRHMPEATPFEFISAAAATADLPPIYDGKPDICIPFPDHRLSLGITKLLRSKIALIPHRPWGMNFATAWYGHDRKKANSGPMTASERDVFPTASTSSICRTRPNSNAYGRQYPNRLIETVVTRPGPGDAKNGRNLHWSEDRVLSIMEARRAQGFRDEEVLLGLPTDQYRIVGNSVAREVAVALGAVFREAWIESLGGEAAAAAMAVEASSISETTTMSEVVVAEESTSESSLDTDTDSTLPRKPSRETPATTVASLSPPPSLKRARSGVLTVEIPSPKAARRHQSDSPSLNKHVATSGVIRPSPLGRIVVEIGNE